jgi:hypothetical protein
MGVFHGLVALNGRHTPAEFVTALFVWVLGVVVDADADTDADEGVGDGETDPVADSVGVAAPCAPLPGESPPPQAAKTTVKQASAAAVAACLVVGPNVNLPMSRWRGWGLKKP